MFFLLREVFRQDHREGGSALPALHFHLSLVELYHLLDNAIKFTPDDGLIEVAIGEDGNSIAVSVINSGSEIPEENRERIFQKFYQADESHATEGNGIGLAIVKRAVELSGGDVSAAAGASLSDPD